MANVSNVRMISEMYKASELDILKDAASLPNIGLCYIMWGSGHVSHMFGLAHAHFAELLNMHSIVFKRHGEASSSTIQMPDYGA